LHRSQYSPSVLDSQSWCIHLHLSHTSSKSYNLSAKLRLSHLQTQTSCALNITYSKQTENRKYLCSYKSGQTCRNTSSHKCLAMYAQTYVGLLCCVCSGSIVAVSLYRAGTVISRLLLFMRDQIVQKINKIMQAYTFDAIVPAVQLVNTND
jgi:hypothetical protein